MPRQRIARIIAVGFLTVAASACGKTQYSLSPPNGASVSTAAQSGPVKPAGACTLPWGGWIATGQSTDAYDVGAINCGSAGGTQQFCKANNSPHHETRTCENGVLSGDPQFSFGTCVENGCQSCSVSLGGSSTPAVLNSGSSIVLYAQAQLACGQKCQSATFTCDNGVLAGTSSAQVPADYPASSCTVAPCSCTAPDPTTGNPVSYASGATLDFWDESQAACGDSCTAHHITLTCSNGIWVPPLYSGQNPPSPLPSPSATPTGGVIAANGDAYFTSCSVAACKACTLPWGGGSVPDYRDPSDPQPITVYGSSAPSCPTACQSASLKCANGVWVGASTGTPYTGGEYQSCSCQCPVTIHGGSTVNIPSASGTNTHTFWTAPQIACGASATADQVNATCTSTQGLTVSGATSSTSGSSGWYDFGSGTPPAQTCSCKSLDPTDPNPTYPTGTQVRFYSQSSISCGRGNSCSSNSTLFTCTNGNWIGGNTTSTWHASCQDVPCASCSIAGQTLPDYQASPTPAPLTLYSAANPVCPGSCQSASVRCDNGVPEYQSAGTWVANDGKYAYSSCGSCECQVTTQDSGAILFTGSHTFYNTQTVGCGDTLANHQVQETCQPATGPTPTPAATLYATEPTVKACTCALGSGTVPVGTGTAYSISTGTCSQTCQANSMAYVCQASGGSYELFESNGNTPLPGQYSYAGCTNPTNCSCTTPWGEVINVGDSRTAFSTSATSCGIPCNTVSVNVTCQLGSGNTGAQLVMTSGSSSGQPLQASQYPYGTCEVSACAGQGGGAGGGQGTGVGRGTSDQNLLPPGSGGGPGGPPLQGCDPLPPDTQPTGIPSPLPTVVGTEAPWGTSTCSIPWANDPPAGEQSFAMGGALAGGVQVFAFTQSSVSGSQTCESVRVPVYCDNLGNLHSASGTLYPSCTSSSSGGSQ